MVSIPVFATAGTQTSPPAGTVTSGYIPTQLLPAQNLNYFFNNTSQMSQEMEYVITQASLVPSSGNLTQLYAAINVQINTKAGALTSAILTTLATDSTSISTGSIKTAGGVGITKALWVGGLANVAGILTASNTTDATSISTGALITPGGLGVTKAAWIGGLMNVAGVLTAANTTQSTSTATGGLVTPGGLGVVKDAFFGGLINVAGDLYTTALTDYSGTSTVVGWTSFTSKQIWYKKVGKLVYVWFTLKGTSNATTTSFTLPIANNGSFEVISFCGRCLDTGADLQSPPYVSLAASASTANVLRYNAAAWTASGVKEINGQFVYQTA